MRASLRDGPFLAQSGVAPLRSQLRRDEDAFHVRVMAMLRPQHLDEVGPYQVGLAGVVVHFLLPFLDDLLTVGRLGGPGQDGALPATPTTVTAKRRARPCA